MRNLRKTRKRGGFQYEPNFYVCEMDVPVTDCITNFAAANNFIVVTTADDGNCFYDTLSKYGAYSGNVRLNKPHMALRREIINTMILNQAAYAPYFVEDKTVSPEGKAIEVNVGKELRKFLRSKQWAGWMGDVIPQVAADILGVNIVIYDVLPSNAIDRITIHPVAGAAATTVNMLRTNGSHFRLLWPRPLAAAALLAPAVAPAVAPTIAPASARRVTARKVSPIPSVTVRKLRAKTPSPTRSITARKSRVNKNFEKNMKKAMAASLANTSAKVEPNASRTTAKKVNSIKNLTRRMTSAQFNNNNNSTSSLENAIEAIEELKRAEALAIKRKEAAAMKAEAAKIVAAKEAAAAAKKEREALELQMALEASIRNLKINNNK